MCTPQYSGISYCITAMHKEKDADGKSLHTLQLHEEKDADGKSVHALKMLSMRKYPAVADEDTANYGCPNLRVHQRCESHRFWSCFQPYIRRGKDQGKTRIHYCHDILFYQTN